MNINHLYKAARTGDSEAEKELFRVLFVRLKLFAYRKIGSEEEAEELVQETLVKVVKGYRELEFTTSFSAWAYKVLKNEIFSFWRRGRRQQKVMSGNQEQNDRPDLNPDPTFEMRVLQCLKKLAMSNSTYSRVLNFKYQGYEPPEICQRLNITATNLYVILHRARKAMKACIEERVLDDDRV